MSRKQTITLASCDETTIHFHPLPKKNWWIWEKLADEIISHEHIHGIIMDIESKEASKKLDRLFPSFQNYLRFVIGTKEELVSFLQEHDFNPKERKEVNEP